MLMIIGRVEVDCEVDDDDDGKVDTDCEVDDGDDDDDDDTGNLMSNLMRG